MIIKLAVTLFSARVVSRFARNGARVVSMNRGSLVTGKFSFFMFKFCAICSSLFLTLKGNATKFILKTYQRNVYFIPVVLLLPSF